MSAPQSWSGPGTIFTFLKLHETSKISQDTLEKWFDEDYVPRLLAAGVIESAALYKAANPKYDKQHLVVYKLADLALVQAGKIDEIPRNSEKGLFDGIIHDYVEYDSKLYSFEQLYETSKKDEEAADTIMYAMIQPKVGGEKELDTWYREEHNQQMSEQPGWKRTVRFRLLVQRTNASKQSEELSFLAIHEFDKQNELGIDVKALVPTTDWNKKVMSEQKVIDAAIFLKVKALGKGSLA